VPAALYLPGRFLVLISVIGSVDHRAMVWLEGLGQLNKSTFLGLEPVTFQLKYVHKSISNLQMDIEFKLEY
jgi:hypothetical protein